MQHIYCLTPLYNDWESCGILLSKIRILQEEYAGKYKFSIVIVNDCSTIEPEDDSFDAKEDIRVVNLNINVGHQRAIAIGLQYIYNEIKDYDAIVVMDSDGEDRPEDIPALLAKCLISNKVIFAQRKKRSESLMFKTGYYFYKQLFKALTGQSISFGNFSAIPAKSLKKIASLSNIWNHYSGAILQSKIPYLTESLDRGKRYAGKSKMNFSSLILHGLSSIAVYFDYLSVRILTFSLYGIGICFISVLYVLYQKLFTDNSIPGWASSLILIIAGIILQLFSVTLIVLLLQLSSRKNIDAPNTKRYLDFIDEEGN